MQDAAGVFAELRDVVSLRVEAPRPVDISPECANMLERLCLAQAQELTFEKFRADGKNPSILARWRSLGWQSCASQRHSPITFPLPAMAPDLEVDIGGSGFIVSS